MATASPPITPKGDHQLRTTIAEYVVAKDKIREHQRIRDNARNEVDRLSAHAESRAKDLAQYVGANITSRCVGLEDGRTVIIRFAPLPGAATIEIYDADGKLVP